MPEQKTPQAAGFLGMSYERVIKYGQRLIHTQLFPYKTAGLAKSFAGLGKHRRHKRKAVEHALPYFYFYFYAG
jgi:hypothetical protein